MADYARWGYAVAEAAGYGGKVFLEAYEQNIVIQHDEAIEASPVAQAIVELMRQRPQWSGAPAELYIELRELIDKLQLEKSREWPKNAASLGKKLASISPNLSAKGIELQRARGRERSITITNTAVAPDAAVAARISKSAYMAKQIDNVRKVFGPVEVIGNAGASNSDDGTTATTAELQVQQEAGHGDIP